MPMLVFVNAVIDISIEGCWWKKNIVELEGKGVMENGSEGLT